MRSLLGAVVGAAGVAILAVGAVVPAGADSSQVSVRVADYVRVADDGAGSPIVESNHPLDVSATPSGYVVTVR